jgi:ferric-dicitrate binding protein FerR (iron transport regulator)
MTEPRITAGREEDDPSIERALTTALSTEPLDDQTLERLRATVMDEWRAANAPARFDRKGRWIAVSAAAVVAALAVGFIVRPTGDAAVVGTVARLDDGGIDVRGTFWRHRTAHVGDALKTGETLTVHGPVLLSLMQGGTLRVAAGSVLDLTGGAEVSLAHGLVYLDVAPSIKSSTPLRIVTRVGAVEHLGTQFEVLSNEGAVRIRVREGRVRLVGHAGTVVASAGTELLASVRGGISQRSVETYGRDWLWVAALAPDYDIEGRPLIDFLQWVSRELGRRIEYADANARDVAARTIMHGSVRGREPLEALADVLATTSLTYEMRADTIRLHSVQ